MGAGGCFDRVTSQTSGCQRSQEAWWGYFGGIWNNFLFLVCLLSLQHWSWNFIFWPYITKVRCNKTIVYTCNLFQCLRTFSIVEQKILICCWELILGCNTPVFQSAFCFIGPGISNYPHGFSRNLQCKLWYIGSWWTNNQPGQWKYWKSE